MFCFVQNLKFSASAFMQSRINSLAGKFLCLFCPRHFLNINNFLRKMNTSLGKAELLLYFISWISCNLYSLYYLFVAQEDIVKHSKLKLEQPLFVRGWTFVNRFKDDSDSEWSLWKYYMLLCGIPLIMHFIGSELIRSIKESLISYWYIAFTLGFLYLNYDVKLVGLFLLQPIMFLTVFLIFLSQAKTPLWVFSVSTLMIVNAIKYSELLWDLADAQQILKDEDIYMHLICLSWIHVRCMSYCFDQMNALKNGKTNSCQPNFKQHFISMLSYTLYFPTLLMGPIVLYSDFKKSLVRQNSLGSRLKRAIFDILKMMIYTFIMELALHYIYFNGLLSNLKFVRMLPSLALCGAGLWMGVQFHLKYVIIYGTGGSIARLDHIEPPPTPRCILRIHLYSHMWKYFDVGLYRFLTACIYKPMLSEMDNWKISLVTKKIMASIMPFLFIFIWHGATLHILIWTMLNYLGILIELLGILIQQTKAYSSFCKHILRTKRMEERFKAFVGTPLLILSAMSNFYLFAGLDVGSIFVKRFLTESWRNIFFIYYFLYTCCNVSAVLSDVPKATAKIKVN